MNKECRQIWIGCFVKCKKLLELCKPHPSKLRADTNRSRCSSTLTVLTDRRLSEPYINRKIDPLELLQMQKSYLFPEHVARSALKARKPRSSTLSLPVRKEIKSVAERNTQIEILVTPPPNDMDCRIRSNSVPVFFRNELETQDTISIEDNNGTISSTSSCVGDALERSVCEDSDVNSEADHFFQEREECSSKF